MIAKSQRVGYGVFESGRHLANYALCVFLHLSILFAFCLPDYFAHFQQAFNRNLNLNLKPKPSTKTLNLGLDSRL